MAQVSRLAVDARQPADAVIPAGAEVHLRHAARVDGTTAAAWQAKKSSESKLVAILDIGEAARLQVPAWLAALQPDAVELRTPAWDAQSFSAIDWPQGYQTLLGVLAALAEAGSTIRLALHVSALTVSSLRVESIAALAAAAKTKALDLRVRPVLGAQAPRPELVAQGLARLVRTDHSIQASQLWPVCALPESVDTDPVFQSEIAAARLAYTPQCEGCEARDKRCLGLAPDLAVASQSAWTGWATFADDRLPPPPPAESDDPVELIGLRLGLRKVWRADMPAAEAESLLAQPPAQLVAVPGPAVAFDPFQGMTVVEGGPLRIVYLAATQAAAEAARAAEANITTAQGTLTDPASHRVLGELLGYPDCCITAFAAAEAARSDPKWAGVAENAYAALVAARSSKVPDRRVDFTTPVQDGCFIRHNACAYDCAASLAQVEALEAEIGDVAPNRLRALRSRRADAILLLADGATIPLHGEVVLDDPSGLPTLRHPKLFGLWRTGSGPTRLAEDALAVLSEQVREATEFQAEYQISGEGGVVWLNAEGVRQTLNLKGLPSHPQFPRLLVFAPLPADFST